MPSDSSNFFLQVNISAFWWSLLYTDKKLFWCTTKIIYHQGLRIGQIDWIWGCFCLPGFGHAEKRFVVKKLGSKHFTCPWNQVACLLKTLMEPLIITFYLFPICHETCIKLLLDKVFVISRTIKVKVGVMTCWVQLTNASLVTLWSHTMYLGLCYKVKLSLLYTTTVRILCLSCLSG